MFVSYKCALPDWYCLRWWHLDPECGRKGRFLCLMVCVRWRSLSRVSLESSLSLTTTWPFIVLKPLRKMTWTCSKWRCTPNNQYQSNILMMFSCLHTPSYLVLSFGMLCVCVRVCRCSVRVFMHDYLGVFQPWGSCYSDRWFQWGVVESKYVI